MGALFTLNITFPSFTPIIAVFTNVQVDHEENTRKRMSTGNAERRGNHEGESTYSDVVKHAIGNSNGVPSTNGAFAKDGTEEAEARANEHLNGSANGHTIEESQERDYGITQVNSSGFDKPVNSLNKKELNSRKQTRQKHDENKGRGSDAKSAEEVGDNKQDDTTDKSYANQYSDGTYLQQHSAYFDPDGDGIVYPWDTYRGCRKFGWGRILSALAAFLINFNLSYFTLPHWLPDPRFPIYIDRVHKNKHGSSSLSYDNLGQFDKRRFEGFIERYDRNGKGGLDIFDLGHAVYGQRMVFDFFGLSATILEWLATYLLIWPKDGIMRKEDIEGVFDGSMFHLKKEEVVERKRK